MSASAILRWQLLSAANRVDTRRRIIERRRARVTMKRADPSNYLSEAEFVKTFRLKKKEVKDLANDLAPHLNKERRSDGMTMMTKILITLAFYATGSYQTLVGQSAVHSVSQKSVSRCIAEVTEAINKIHNKYVKWPNTREERNTIKAKFYQQFKIPGVLACIDGTHVAILRPHIHEERYFNRKGYHSLNVMIVCDADLNILCVDPSSPGSAHDSSVWQNHPLRTHMAHLTESGEQVFFLGDSGYPLRKTIMTPILNTMEDTPKHNYYKMHVTARNTVERCIGVLKARFRCLLVARALHYDPIKAGKIVNACCVLHNIANQARILVTPLTIQEANAELLQQQHGEDSIEVIGTQEHNSRVNPDLQEGRALQRAIVDRLWRERTQ